jgi:DNA-binding MarR family transcriptional regulator
MRLKQQAGGKAAEDADYQALAEFRHQIRRFLHSADQVARGVGIEPKQYELLLAIRGIPEDAEPTIGALAEQLRLRHHSAVELVNRAETKGLVERSRDGTRVLVRLTKKGQRILAKAVQERLQELRVDGPVLVKALHGLIRSNGSSRKGARQKSSIR